MQITEEFLRDEMAKMKQQEEHARNVMVAARAAADTLRALLNRLEAPEEEPDDAPDHTQHP